MSSDLTGAHAVAVLGSIKPTVPRERALATLCDYPADVAARELKLQGTSRHVLSIVATVAPEYAQRMGSDSVLSAHVERITAVAGGVDDCLALLGRIGRDVGITVWGIKGVSARRFYEEHDVVRDLTDVDVMVRTAEEGFALATALLDRGYWYDERELPWLKRDVDRTLYGQINLQYETPDEQPNVDIHFGGYSVRHCGLIPVTAPKAEAGLACYSMQDNIPVMVANAAGDHWVSMKDLNDLYIALTARDVDWETIDHQLRDVGLRAFFAHALALLRASHALDPATAELVDERLHAARARPEWPRPGNQLSWQRRWAVTTIHATRLGRRQSAWRAAVCGVSAARYYRRPLHLRLRRGMPGVATRLPPLNNWTCARLVPAELVDRLWKLPPSPPGRFQTTDLIGGSTTGGGVVAIRTAAGDLLKSARTVFVPTVYYGVDRRLASTALGLSGS
jgi:hypothetical protein